MKRPAIPYAFILLLVLSFGIAWRLTHPPHPPVAVSSSGDARLEAQLTCPGDQFVLILTNRSNGPLLIIPSAYELNFFDRDGNCLTEDNRRGKTIEEAAATEPIYWKLEPGKRYEFRLVVAFDSGPIPVEAILAECTVRSEFARWSNSETVKSMNCPLVTPRAINRLKRSSRDPAKWK